MPESGQGLSFQFTKEQDDFRRSLRAFVEDQLPKEYCREVEAREDFPWDLRDRIADHGLYGIGVSPEYGGQGGDVIDQTIVAEELSRTMAGLLWIWGVSSHSGAMSLDLYGTESQKERYLPLLADGKLLVAMAMTEPNGGTDLLGSMRTKAERVEGGWRINGTKMWSTMAHVADVILLAARTKTNTSRSSDGITLFLCDAKNPGITATPIPKLGMRSLGSCEVLFQDVFVSDDDVLGEPDRGWSHLTQTFNNERLMVAGLCCGAMQGVLEDMVDYSLNRVAFGKPIGQFQAIQHMIADTHIDLETARLHTYRAAWNQVQGNLNGVESTMAKIVASDAALKAADRGIQILGGYGYSTEFDMQRYWRDLRLYTIGPISNEMARNYVAEQLGLPRSF